jgi:hypothetical protein
MRAMLAQEHRDWWQLSHLMTPETPARPQLIA